MKKKYKNQVELFQTHESNPIFGLCMCTTTPTHTHAYDEIFVPNRKISCKRKEIVVPAITSRSKTWLFFKKPSETLDWLRCSGGQ